MNAQLTKETQDKTIVTFALPVEAADRLLAMYQANPEAVKKHFADLGFDVESILPVQPKTDKVQ